MELTATAAAWFLPAVLPICVFVAWNDMREMKILNLSVYALVLIYAVLGLFALPFDLYLWHWTHLVVALVIGIVLNAMGVMGAGDAKFIAAAAPFVALADLSFVMILLAICFATGFATHRLAMRIGLDKRVPHWQSWNSGNKFPMGFPLGMTLSFYLLYVFFTR